MCSVVSGASGEGQPLTQYTVLCGSLLGKTTRRYRVPSYLLAYEAARTVIGTVIMFNDTNSELAIHYLLLTGVRARATSSPFDGTIIISSSHVTFEYCLRYVKPPVVCIPNEIGSKIKLTSRIK